jgi:hypothetical protein
MEQFRDKNICLILTCDKPYYKNRLEKNKQTIDYLKSLGFCIVYLYGDITKSDSLEQINTSEFVLTVSVQDSYECLSLKMYKAYVFLQESKCKGILKLDDDTKILNTQLFEAIILNQLECIDYVGIEKSDYTYINVVFYNKINSIEYKLHETQIKNPLLPFTKRLFTVVDTPFQYMAGPFYWISNKALQYICKDTFEYIDEDASVGYCIQKYSDLTVQSNDMLKGVCVSWSDETES